MNKILLFAMAFFTVTVAWAQETSTVTPSDSTETINADNVPIEEYVPKVIIEGKWGSGPGEFGIASRFPLGHFDQYKPNSLAVNSKGQVYVLDYVNNRIQKFDREGKYLISIPVEGLKGILAGYCAGDTCYEEPPVPGQKFDRPVMGDVETIGINIVIDSKDTLYYYLKRVKNGKETGEVWEFKNDKLVKKSTQKIPTERHKATPASEYVDTKIDADVKEKSGRGKFAAGDRKKRAIDFQLADGEELYGRRKVIFDESSKKWAVRIKKAGKIWDRVYDPSGKLLSITEVPRLSEFSDTKRNYYFIEIGQNGLTIRKRELVRTLK